MSKSSKVVAVRFPNARLEAMKAYIAKSAETRIVNGEWTVNEFILAAVQEKLDRIARSAAKRNKKVKIEAPPVE